MDNKILIYGAIGLGAYLLLSNKKDSTNSGGGSGGERTYTIRPNQYPNVPAGTYKESELVNFGFVEYPVGSGVYYHQTQFVAPPNTDTTSPSWLNYLNTAINLGTTLYTTVTDVASSIKKMKTTEVKWDNNIVAVDLAYGYAVYRGFIDPTSNITKTAGTLSIQIRPLAGNKVSIKYVRSEISSTGQITNSVQKEGTIDFATRTLTGFDAGSVSGVYMAGYCNTCLRPNYDVPVNIMGIGALKKKGSRLKNAYNREVDLYKYFVYNFDSGRVESGFQYKQDAIDMAMDFNNAKVFSLQQLKKMGIADPRPNWKYIEGIGATKNSYKVYHNSYHDAVVEAIDYANANGYIISDEDIWREVVLHKKRPKLGQTTRISLPIYKNGKEQKKMLHFQVYGMDNKYELNSYIGSTYDYMHPKAITHCFDGTYSDAGKGACSYHGGAHEIKLRKNVRDYTGKGKYAHYIPYRKQYKKDWANKNKDKVKTL